MSVYSVHFLQIVVVPDNVTQGNVPHITGLLAYQEDVEVLRIRKIDAWKVLAEEEKVNAFKITHLVLYYILYYKAFIISI